MMNIVLRKWEELDIRHLAKITSEIRMFEGIGDQTVDTVEEYLKSVNERYPLEIVLLIIEDEQILGWLGFERISENLGEISRWHPFVLQETNRDVVAQLLISKINSYARDNGVSRMEVGFGGLSETSVGTYNQRQSWYESEGWTKIEDNNFMSVNPMDYAIEDPGMLEGFNLRPLLDVNNDIIFPCYHESFTTGQATWIYDMTKDQRRQEFEKFFDRTQQINGPASFIVEKEGEILGFALVISRSDEEEHLESIGIHSSVRGRGLGKLMLSRIMEVLQNQNANRFTLGVDPVNIPAFKLYEKFGFELVSRTITYSWKVNDL